MNIGVTYTNLNLKEMTELELKEFGKQIAKDNIVVVRNQTCNEADILRICESFGNVSKPKQFFMHPDYPGLFRVTNERKDGEKIGIFADKELDWHSNGNGRPSGKECCVALYCIKPGQNSITSFCDTRQAYNDLPNNIKEIVNDVDCTFQFKNNTFYELDEDDKELLMFENKQIYPNGIIKPLVYTHPYDSDKGLYFTFHYIRNMWRRSGKDLDQNWLKTYLMNHVFQEKYMYHHVDWRQGDFIFMDQFHSIHKRNKVIGDRFLYRISFDYERLNYE
jgi:alpha-ketoglutarate-dependent 2,4-dichlorophenoxyacetate dioxygenase